MLVAREDRPYNPPTNNTESSMDHLSGLDAGFLHLETPETPLHVGGLAMFELPPEYKGDFVADVCKHIQSRLHLSPIFQRKLVNMPFDLANPVWVMDKHLDIEHHIRRQLRGHRWIVWYRGFIPACLIDPVLCGKCMCSTACPHQTMHPREHATSGCTASIITPGLTAWAARY